MKIWKQLFGTSKQETPKGQKSKQQILGELQTMFRDQAGSIFPYARRFRDPYGDLAVRFVGLARELGSKAPIEVFRKATNDYPNSGLAWYVLFFAITMCDNPSSSSDSDILARAAKLGCDYVTVKDGKMVVSEIR